MKEQKSHFEEELKKLQSIIDQKNIEIEEKDKQITRDRRVLEPEIKIVQEAIESPK